MTERSAARLLPTLIVCGLLATPALAVAATTESLVQADAEVAEALLLDVGIRLFDPGLPEDDDSALEEQGVYPEVRKSEARFIPFHLKSVLESTGFWGAVRVVPDDGGTADVVITGKILRSTGLGLAIRLQATDSRGVVWRDRRYKDDAESAAYADDEPESLDPYQDIYHRIANDLLTSLKKLDADDILQIRETSRLTFAAGLAPAVFDEHLLTKNNGRIKIVRLPAADDPMLHRIDRIRERDHMFIDTLNEYYADFYLLMDQPYGDWREISFDEELKLRAIRRKARTKKILGGLLMVGAVVTGGSSTAAQVARTSAAVAGAMTLQDGIQTAQQAKIHKAALQELAASFDAEMEPLLVEVDGQLLRLEGSAEAQYSEWRRLLAEIFAAETGLAEEPAASPGPAHAGPLEQ